MKFPMKVTAYFESCGELIAFGGDHVVKSREEADRLAAETAAKVKENVLIQITGQQYHFIAGCHQTDHLAVHGGRVIQKLKTAAAIREEAANGGAVYVEGFASQEARDAFVAKFPKSLRVKGSTCSSYSRVELTALIYIPPTKVSATREVSKVTGAVNETGARRLEGFIRVLIAEGIIEG